MRIARRWLSTPPGYEQGRAALAQQFASLRGWQSGESARFDEFVASQRERERFDGFDQRVERAYRSALKGHKAEVWNAAKRKLKSSSAPVTPQILQEIQRTIEERTSWLRDVWAQIDADYRSDDTTRQERAASEISSALRGEPHEYMTWAYEQKLSLRESGPKRREELESQGLGQGDDLLGNITEFEASRYGNLVPRMSAIEQAVKSKYGLAGVEHWTTLQEAKDRHYEAKMDKSREVYKKLLEQQDNYDEHRHTKRLRLDAERINQASLRFQSALELEAEREKVMEAHAAMKKRRNDDDAMFRREQLKQAAELRMRGVPNEEIQQRLKEVALSRHIDAFNSFLAREKTTTRERLAQYRIAIANARERQERQEGEELMTTAGPFDVRTDEKESNVARARAQWEDINSDKLNDPFRTVHQARVDAQKTFDDIYSKMTPDMLGIGHKRGRQNMGEYIAGNNLGGQIMQSAPKLQRLFHWGMQARDVHDLDLTKGRDYMISGTNTHVQDPVTGDVDWRFEKKSGGVAWTGTKFYKIGEEFDKKRPSQQVVLPQSPQR